MTREISLIKNIRTFLCSISTKPLFSVFTLADKLVHNMLTVMSSVLMISVTIPIAGVMWIVSFMSSLGTRVRSFVLDTFFFFCGEVICTFCTMIIMVICGILFWTLNTHANIYKRFVGMR